MDSVAFFRRLCNVEIRRLLLLIGMLVAIVVVYQCFELPYGKTLFLSPVYMSFLPMITGNNGTTVDNSELTRIHVAVANDLPMITGNNGTTVDNSELTRIHVAVANDTGTKETDEDYDLGLDVGNFLDDSFHKYKDENLQMEGLIRDKSLIVGYVTSTDNGSTGTKATESERENKHLARVDKLENSYKIDDGQKATAGLTLGIKNRPGNPSVVSTEIPTRDAKSSTSVSILSANLSSVSNVKQTIQTQRAKTELLQTVSIILSNNLSMGNTSTLRRRRRHPTSISQMNSLLLQSRVSSHFLRPRQSSSRDRELLSAKLQIENAPNLENTPGFHASVFRNASMFKRSYELMENMLKVYIYKEGEKPIFHQPHMRGIYASEGWFMKLIERNKKFVARDPRKAHLFYLPFSARMLRFTLFEQDFRSHKDLQYHLKNYVELIAGKYRFWNRTGGADHFLVACHDWAPRLTRQHMKNCIRALCNADVSKGFNIGLDTSLPVTYVRSVENPLEELGGKPPLERSILAFFAGSMHGYLRPILLKFWENKEADMKIFGPMTRDIKGKRNYREYMKSSKYCICARGYEVHSPRVVEAIFYECVPVIISDNYMPPFFEVLNWEAFSVFVQEKDVPNLRNILLSIPEERYVAMQSGVKLVQKHFLWHKKPEKYDIFHMILHSVWYNRVFNVKSK